MTQQGVRWTAEQVLALAPDDASRTAGSRLGAAGPWSQSGCDRSGAVWGLCEGSGGKPYRTVIDTNGPGYQCTCPSRKLPCKHAVGLLLLWVEDERAVPVAAVPEWVERWLDGRGERAGHGEGGPTDGDSTVVDPEAARRRAEKRAARVTAGATELEQRLADLLRGGIAAAERPGYGLWEETAARMVDAQAPGLAARVRELGATVGSGPGWPMRLLEECALLHLLDRAWLGRDALPEPLAATVRSHVGLPTPPRARTPAVRDSWQVLAQYDTADAKLTTRRIWLYGRESGRWAMVLDFGAAGRAPGIALPVGLAIDADLTPYPGAGRLRAALGERYAAPVAPDGPPPGGTTTEAVERYGRALQDDPWLDACPAMLTEVIPVPPQDGDGGWQLADAKGDLALPVARAATARAGLWKLLALSGGAPVTVFGECGHRGFTPLAAWPEGDREAVALT
ncbi:SWIM zinc finger family protein [Streptomyces sp. NPDC048416]|uniref:SWIM zinc finger family protein n=1 Tax=Streptomyces sp. NPDC048416 TaxID=3365546 RepID=UPI00371F6C16